MARAGAAGAMPTLFHGPAASARLGELGVGQQRLFDALDAGDLAARQADEFSPINAAGMLRWLETVRRLREGLAADGWLLNDDRNSPRVVHPSGELAVVPVSGSSETGLVDGLPRTANPRGAASSRAVQVNGQLELGFPVALLADLAGEKLSGVVTYFLLYHRSEHDELRSELSLPTRISERGIVSGWRERILLPPRAFGAVERLPRDAGGDDGVDFDIAAR
jgi:hypothetical protein